MQAVANGTTLLK